MLIIIIGILISVALFYYFQQKQSNRNIEQFEKRRDRYYQMLEQLKKNKEQNGEVSDTTSDQ
jgi:type II secretory pathway pseudopilin PulG